MAVMELLRMEKRRLSIILDRWKPKHGSTDIPVSHSSILRYTAVLTQSVCAWKL